MILAEKHKVNGVEMKQLTNDACCNLGISSSKVCFNKIRKMPEMISKELQIWQAVVLFLSQQLLMSIILCKGHARVYPRPPFCFNLYFILMDRSLNTLLAQTQTVMVKMSQDHTPHRHDVARCQSTCHFKKPLS